MRKVLLLFYILILTSLTAACSPAKGELNPSFWQYKRDNLGFSIEYPKDWIIEEFNDNEIGIKPRDGTNTEIQIGAFSGTPILSTMPADEATILIEASLYVFVNSLEGSGLIMISNEPAGSNSNDWDWVARFFYYYEGLPVRGGYYLQETSTMSYTLIFISGTQPPEIDKVIDSFTIY